MCFPKEYKLIRSSDVRGIKHVPEAWRDSGYARVAVDPPRDRAAERCPALAFGFARQLLPRSLLCGRPALRRVGEVTARGNTAAAAAGDSR